MWFKSESKKLSIACTIVFGLLFSSASQAFFFDHAGDFDFSAITRGHELGCLALNIYHEGRGESLQGQEAIAAVTMNRIRSRQYPDTVCEVVWQRKQFSWTHIASRHHSVSDVDAWQQALVIARLFLDGARVALVGDATHYHADSVKPYWIAENKPIGKVGNHYFYAL
jgi:spore germination cell wall hydrolase CwlJ-like protein